MYGFFFWLFFCHNGSKQGKEPRKHIYINFAIFGEDCGSVLRMDEAERPRGLSPPLRLFVNRLRLR